MNTIVTLLEATRQFPALAGIVNGFSEKAVTVRIKELTPDDAYRIIENSSVRRDGKIAWCCMEALLPSRSGGDGWWYGTEGFGSSHPLSILFRNWANRHIEESVLEHDDPNFAFVVSYVLWKEPLGFTALRGTIHGSTVEVDIYPRPEGGWKAAIRKAVLTENVCIDGNLVAFFFKAKENSERNDIGFPYEQDAQALLFMRKILEIQGLLGEISSSFSGLMTERKWFDSHVLIGGIEVYAGQDWIRVSQGGIRAEYRVSMNNAFFPDFSGTLPTIEAMVANVYQYWKTSKDPTWGLQEYISPERQRMLKAIEEIHFWQESISVWI